MTTTEHDERFARLLADHRRGDLVLTEAEVRATHRYTGSATASGHATVHNCTCGARWYDDLDCPKLESELDALT